MKQLAIAGLALAIVLFGATACGSKSTTEVAQSQPSAKGDAMSQSDAGADAHVADAAAASPQGMWRIPPGQRSRSEPGTVEGPPTTRFLLDGDTVTLFLFTEKEWMWKTADDHYRLKAQWVGDELQYLPPFGRWSKLATFRNGRFESDGVKAPWIFERVTDAMKDTDDRMLDKPRTLHDYSIKPMDKPSP